MNFKSNILAFIRHALSPLEAQLAWLSRSSLGLAGISRLAIPHLQFVPGSFRTLQRDGLTFQVDLSDYIDWKLYFRPWSKERRKLFSLIRPGDFILEVGSHKGATLLEIRRVAGENARIIAFEAHPANYAACKKNLELNHVKNIELVPIALGARSGKIKYAQNRAHNSSGHRVARESEADLEVPIITLDEYLKNESASPNVLKITVNGYEEAVLRGAENVIRKSHPILYLHVCDVMSLVHESSAKNILQLLESWGYSIYRADNGEQIHASADLTSFDAELYAKISPSSFPLNQKA